MGYTVLEKSESHVKLEKRMCIINIDCIASPGTLWPHLKGMLWNINDFRKVFSECHST